MSNPNILNITSIYGGVAYLAPSNTSVTTLISNEASSSSLLKVESLTCTNVTANTANVTVSVTSGASGTGTAYRLAYQIPVPGNSSLQLIDKNNFVYLVENMSIVVTSGTSSSLEYVASYETMS